MNRTIQNFILICLIAAGATATHAQQVSPPVINGALSYAQALSMADVRSISIAQSRADASIAHAATGSARAAVGVGISATTYASAGDSANVLTSAASVQPQNILLASPKGFADQNITLMAPIFTGGRLESALKAAMAQSMAADESLKATMLASESDAAQAYLIAVLQSSLVEVAQGRVTAEEAQVAAAKEKVTEGKLAPVDLLREQTELAQANQALIEARNSAALALVDMKQALGISQLSAVTILNSVETLPALPAPQATLEQALSHAAANRADLRAASRMNDAAADQIRSTHSEYSPQVYGVVMADATAQSGEFREGYTIGIAASIPLYDSGSRKADEAAAAAKALRAHADAAQAQLSIEQSVAAAWLNLQTAKSKLDVAQAGLGAAGESSRLADLRYTGGKSTVAERLDAFAALIRARGDMAQAKVGVTIAQVRLLAAVGDRPESLN